MLSEWSVTSESAVTACFQMTFVALTNVSWLRMRNKIFIWLYSAQTLHIQDF